MEKLAIVAGIVSTFLTAGSGLLWILKTSESAAKKKYAAEREFGHIKNSLLQLTNNLTNEFQDLERRLDEIKSDIQEIKFECRIDKK